MLKTRGPWFVDDKDKVVLLRGVNLGGSTKVPSKPDGSTYRSEGFFNHRNVSFVGRPFPLEEADEHYTRLKSWGFNCLRFLITWEALEHAGPGIYDEEYLDYLYKVVKKAGEYGFHVFIDPHQDVWSRFSGGDGAPGWTLEAAGFDMTAFKETGAAIVHQTHGDPFPRMVWPTNAYKLAAATMFTLFFAGNDFAPKTQVEGVPIQEYLQNHYLESIRKVAVKLKGVDCIIGYDTLNEPQRGYVEVKDLAQPYGELDFGYCPTPWQSILLGSGIPQVVDKYNLTVLGKFREKRTLMNPEQRSAWLPGRTCIWRENGVWDSGADRKPVLIKSDHFARLNGREVDFLADHLVPFVKKYEKTIHSVDPDALIFLESDIFKPAPMWENAEKVNIVYAPHFYDGATLFLKKYFSWLAHDNRTDKIVLGKRRIKESFIGQLKQLADQSKTLLGNVPVLIGEVGIPYDMNNKRSYSTGNFSSQVKAMDRSIRALEANLLNYTLWNYTSDNTNERGDRWNDEDLSIFSRDQQFTPQEVNSGGRALEAVVRPFPMRAAGEPLSVSFDYISGEFEFTFSSIQSNTTETLIFVPAFQYPTGAKVDISDGEFTLDQVNQVLTYTSGSREIHTIRLFRN